MRVIFAAEVLERQEAWKSLTRILYKVDDGWHLWEVEDPELVENSNWYRNRSGDAFLDELLREAATRTAWNSTGDLHSQRVRVTDRPSEQTWELNPEVAVRALEEPLRIVVEDRESDGLFLDVVVKTLGSTELVDLYKRQPPSLSVRSPGGRDKIKRHLETDLRKFESLEIPARLFVFIDSDAPQPGQPSRESDRVVRFCDEHGISHHRLKKRAMENYVPKEALEAWAREPENREHEPAITRLGRLSRAQWDHLPKQGFVKGTPANTGTLYDDLSDEDKRLLQWRRRRVKPFEEALEQHQNEISAQNLRDRCGSRNSDERRELDDLLSKIIRLL